MISCNKQCTNNYLMVSRLYLLLKFAKTNGTSFHYWIDFSSFQLHNDKRKVIKDEEYQ